MNLWFLYLAFQAPHAPFVLPPKRLLPDNLIAEVEGKVRELTGHAGYRYTEGQRLLSFEVLEGGDAAGGPSTTARLPDTSLARAAYAAMVAAVDTEIARLRANTDLSNTYIILLGDNGTSGDVMDEDRAGFPNADAYLRGKGTLFQGGVSIPFMVSGPNIPKPGRRSGSLVHTSDVYATILEMAGIEGMRDGARIDGLSVMDDLRSERGDRSKRLVNWSDYGPNPPGNSRDNPNDSPWGYAIRDDRYKLKSDAVYKESADVECKFLLPADEVCRIGEWRTESAFFDLLNDPTEQVDLLANGEAGLSWAESMRLSLLRLQQKRILESFE